MLPRDRGARRLDVVVPEHLAREQRHAERPRPDREPPGTREHVVALERGPAGAIVVVVEIRVVVASVIEDSTDSNPKPLRGIEVHLGPQLEPAAFDDGLIWPVVHAVVAREE